LCGGTEPGPANPAKERRGARHPPALARICAAGRRCVTWLRRAAPLPQQQRRTSIVHAHFVTAPQALKRRGGEMNYY
jgi:hypothetical protein